MVNLSSTLLTTIFEMVAVERNGESIFSLVNSARNIEEKYEALIMVPYLAKCLPKEQVYFEKRAGGIPNHETFGMTFPNSVKNREDIYVYTSRRTGVIGNETDFRLFSIMNIKNPKYHLLKIALIVREELRKSFDEIAKRKTGYDEYYLITTGKTISEEEVLEEIQLFQDLAILYAFDVLNSKNPNDWKMKVKDLKDRINLFSKLYPDEEQWYSERVIKAVKEGNFDISKFSSKLIDNLQWKVADFVSRAYEAVYNEMK